MSPTPALKRTVATLDRRRAARFPLSIPVQYTVGQLHGQSVMRDVSSDGVLIKTDRPLPVGKRLQLRMHWPAKLEGRTLSLVLRGRVIRSTADGTAVQIMGYECQIDSRLVKSALRHSR